MNTRLILRAAGIILAALGTGWAQPVITNPPSPQAAAPGATVTFQVGASSAEPIEYQWQKNVTDGFIDLSERRNSALVLTNVQPWDASDYRVLLGNSLGVVTSAVARLYVVRTPLLTTNVVIDNFDDNRLTGWLSEGHKGQVKLTETDRQFKVWGYWPGVSTMHADLADTESYGSLGRSWSVLNGQTVEYRVDLVGLSDDATMAGFALWSDASSAAYVLFKGHDFIHLCKPSLSVAERHGHFFHERALIKDTNVVLSLAVTRVNPNAIITTRVLDKANNNAVLYERSAVDTPRIDRTLTESELESASGMHLHTGTDAGAPITSGSHVFLTVFQYNDGTRPPAEAIYDNLERRTSTFPVWRPEIAIQASTNSPNVILTLSAAPNSSWAVERAPQLAGPWAKLSTLLIGANGSAQFQDADSPNSAGFYRARQQ